MCMDMYGHVHGHVYRCVHRCVPGIWTDKRIDMSTKMQLVHGCVHRYANICVDGHVRRQVGKHTCVAAPCLTVVESRPPLQMSLSLDCLWPNAHISVHVYACMRACVRTSRPVERRGAGPVERRGALERRGAAARQRLRQMCSRAQVQVTSVCAHGLARVRLHPCT